MFQNQIVYWLLYKYADDDSLLVLCFNLFLVYLKHTFHFLFNETVNHTNLVIFIFY